MTREEKLKALGVKPLEWKYDGFLGSRHYETVTLNPHTQEEMEYEIEIRELSTKGYCTTIKLIGRSGTLVLGEMLSDDCISDNELKEIVERDFYNRIVESAKEVGITAPAFEEEGADGHHTPTQAEILLSEVTPLEWDGEEDDEKCDLSARLVLIDEEDEDEDDALAIEFEIDSNKKHGFCSLYVKASGKWELGYYNIINSRGYNIPIEELKAKAEEVRLSMAKRLLGIKE